MPAHAARPEPGAPAQEAAPPDVDDIRTDWSWPGFVRTALLVVLAALVLGAVVGLVWTAVAPHDAYRVAAQDGGVFYLPIGDSAAIAADGWLGGLCLLAGVLTALAGARALARQPLGLLAGLLVGGVLGALVARGVGEHLDPFRDLQALGAGRDVGDRFSNGLRVRAPGVLLGWPLASCAVVFVLAAARRATGGSSSTGSTGPEDGGQLSPGDPAEPAPHP